MYGKTMVSNYKKWAVIGDVANTTKYAYKILEKFKEKNYEVAAVNRKGGQDIYVSLKDVPFKVECIDLCINPKIGIDFIKEAKDLNIKNILIQPGAESDEILDYCKKNNMDVVQSCALMQLKDL